MATNTIRHVSDQSAYKIFNPIGTSFPANIVDVQAALAALKPIAINGIPNASQSLIGISRFGTQAEVDAGVLDNVGVSPATLKSTVTRPQATTTVVGLTRYATDAETKALTINNAAVVPSSLKLALDDVYNKVFVRQATESIMGVAKVSTTVAAVAGTDDTTMMTPKKTLQAINNATSKIPSPEIATQTKAGISRLATSAEVQNGVLDIGVSVSPLGLKSLTALTNRNGLVSLTTGPEVAAGTNNTKAITPLTLLSRTGAVNRLGLVKLTTTVGSGDANTALAFNANVIHTNGGQTINGSTTMGNLNVTGNLTRAGKQVVTTDMLGDDVPVGVVMMWVSNAALPAKWHDLDGWSGYTAQSHPELWRVHPGGLPDMRGLFPRGTGTGAAIQGAQGNDDKGKPRLGVGCGGGAVGTVQAQMVRRHKHASAWGERNDRNWGKYGATTRFGYVGSQRTDWDNYSFFTNDGDEIEAANIRDSFGTMNSEGLMGNENRPWNMSVRYIIKIQ